MTERSFIATATGPQQALGERLRQARLARDASAAQAAAELRMPQAMIDAMERGDLSRLGASIYARGYLRGYARWLGLPQDDVDIVLEPLQAESPPPLHSASRISHGRYLMERYARRAVYIVLTASIVVPVVWLATQERLPVDPVALRSLDSLPLAPQAAGESGKATLGAVDPAAIGPPETMAGDSPVVASFTSFLGKRAAPRPEAVPVAPGWRMVFRGDSWVEIIDRDGQRLEFGVIRAGSEREFAAGTVARVALGNASVVDVFHAGQPVSIAPFQRANVARFAVSSEDELLPPGG
ncbi:MAG: RodZ domain-containing protein [Lysobacteraceae bacterium]